VPYFNCYSKNGKMVSRISVEGDLYLLNQCKLTGLNTELNAIYLANKQGDLDPFIISWSRCEYRGFLSIPNMIVAI